MVYFERYFDVFVLSLVCVIIYWEYGCVVLIAPFQGLVIDFHNTHIINNGVVLGHDWNIPILASEFEDNNDKFFTMGAIDR